MSNPDLVVTILAFVAFSIPIVGALWRIFAVREELSLAIRATSHRLDLLEQKLDSLNARQTLAFNGLKERIDHIRQRTQAEEKDLEHRLGDVEGYLEKHTEFSKRYP